MTLLPDRLEQIARVSIKKAGTLIGSRRGINLIEGSGVTITTTDDATDEEVDVTLTANPAGIDHGGLGGLADDDHTQYQKSSLLTTRGDLPYRGASAWSRLAVGAANRVLRSDGTDPSWGQVATGDVTDNAITAAKIAAAVAGDGLAGGAGSALSVNVDSSTIEINSDSLRVKDSGVSTAKIAASAVTSPKMAAITRTVLGAAASSISVTVPTVTNGLLLRVRAKVSHNTTTAVEAGIQFNGDTTATSYNWQLMYGTGGSAAAAQDSSDPYIRVAIIGNESATRWTLVDATVFDYTSADNKSLTYVNYEPRNGSTTQLVNSGGGYWDGTSAITSVQITAASGNFSAGSWLSVEPVAYA